MLKWGTCASCEFWLKVYSTGQCRLNPPAVLLRVSNSNSYPFTQWPETLPEEGCGQHQDREQPNDEG